MVDATETRQRALAQTDLLRQELAAAEDLTPFINPDPGLPWRLVKGNRPADQPASQPVSQPA